MKQKLYPLILLSLILLAFAPCVDADVYTDQGAGSFYLIKQQGEVFVAQDLGHGLNINFTVNTGALYSLSTLTINSSGGYFSFYSSTAATLKLNPNNYLDPLTLLVDGVAYSGLVAVPIHQVVIVSWIYTSPITPTITPAPTSTAAPTPTPLPPSASPAPTVNPTVTATSAPTTNPLFPISISSSAMWQYLYSWDFAGFVIATWTYSLGQSFFVILAFIVSLAVYIRYQNLIAVSIIWITLGSAFVVWIPMVTPFVIFAFAFGFGSLIYKIYETRN
jgi:hypothetical protein